MHQKEFAERKKFQEEAGASERAAWRESCQEKEDKTKWSQEMHPKRLSAFLLLGNFHCPAAPDPTCRYAGCMRVCVCACGVNVF